MGDGTHREQAEHITAADAHEKVENVVDGASSVDGWLPVLDLDVIEETLDNDEAGGDGEDQDWNDVPGVVVVLPDQRVDCHQDDGGQDDEIPPRSGEDDPTLAGGGAVRQEYHTGVHYDDDADEGDEDDREDVPQETDYMMGEEKDKSIKRGYDEEEKSVDG